MSVDLKLIGFVNPRELLPAFLVPLFGSNAEFWIQDGETPEAVTKFTPCKIPNDKIIYKNIPDNVSTRIGNEFLYAFQFRNGDIEFGTKDNLQEILSDRLVDFEDSPFLLIDILRFVERPDAIWSAINTAKQDLAKYNSSIAEKWALTTREEEILKPFEFRRSITQDGPHTREALKVLEREIGAFWTKVALYKASRIINLAINPYEDRPSIVRSDGLLYGLIQSGKTSILTVTAAMAADNGFDCILILTADNDLLYAQTLERVRSALRGLTIRGKNDWKDNNVFKKQINSTPFGIVSSKNGQILRSLLSAFKQARAKKLSVLVIDDEADQASLNTKASKKNSKASPINEVITGLRSYFPKHTYLQVTATPQALFLQTPDHEYRPTFTVLTQPGDGYVGGDQFFGKGSVNLLRYVDIEETEQLIAPGQPTPNGKLPAGLKKALFSFFVGAASKVIERPSDNFAFLCHHSMSTKDHKYIGSLLYNFKVECAAAIEDKNSGKYKAIEKSLKESYEDLLKTDPKLPDFVELLPKIEFYLKGATIKLINNDNDEEIKSDSVFSIFVGGNKLSRGVTIKNLLVSYYARNPKKPNADTVLQHARMYGYRQADVGVTRLYLPERLANHFKSIHEMEKYLRQLIQKYPDGRSEGLYISGDWAPTRKNVLDPNSIGCYVEGRSYNPRKPLRTSAANPAHAWIDDQLKNYNDQKPYEEIDIARLIQLIEKIEIDPKEGAELWNPKAIHSALEAVSKKLKSDKAYLVVRRDRGLKQVRSESHGIIQSAEGLNVPRNAPTLFMYRTTKNNSEIEVWWPQVRFPSGEYVFAFSFKP